MASRINIILTNTYRTGGGGRECLTTRSSKQPVDQIIMLMLQCTDVVYNLFINIYIIINRLDTMLSIRHVCKI